ncbi:MAG: nucleotidyltransferase family protein [Nanoarchaeota archaeon]|nr:nucleotidyltransferase family protein [Nanoarchaeota archaeon]
MPYTEIKTGNKNKYYYRVKSVREKDKITKQRIYLGTNLNKKNLQKKELEADKIFLNKKIEKNIKEIKGKIVKILKKSNIKKAGIFGSYARGEQKKNSDIDILIQVGRGKFSLFDLVGLKIILEETLHRKVDVNTYRAIHPRLRKKILNEEVRIL